MIGFGVCFILGPIFVVDAIRIEKNDFGQGDEKDRGVTALCVATEVRALVPDLGASEPSLGFFREIGLDGGEKAIDKATMLIELRRSSTFGINELTCGHTRVTVASDIVGWGSGKLGLRLPAGALEC